MLENSQEILKSDPESLMLKLLKIQKKSMLMLLK